MNETSGKPTNRRFLWWVAGADNEVLAECPKGDRLFVSHLGIALCCAFLFVFLISAISINVAFPNLDTFAKGWSVIFAGLIGVTIFLIDRSFIISDWDWQASLRRDELAKAGWENLETPSPLSVSTPSRAFARIRRSTAIAFRLVLSLAIGYSIASFLELVIYRDEIRTEIEAQHDSDNKSIYDRIGERESELAYEIKQARETRDRIQTDIATIEGQITEAVSNPHKERFPGGGCPISTVAFATLLTSSNPKRRRPEPSREHGRGRARHEVERRQYRSSGSRTPVPD